MNKEKETKQIFIDPVCYMEVKKMDGTPSIMHNFRTYYFCAESCRNAFEKNPEKYLNPKSKRKGLWVRYLERLERATGGKSLNCH